VKSQVDAKLLYTGYFNYNQDEKHPCHTRRLMTLTLNSHLRNYTDLAWCYRL